MATTVTVFAIDDVLYVANLGDSRAVLCRETSTEEKSAGKGDVIAIKLTKVCPLLSLAEQRRPMALQDHSPTNYEERMRIQKAGGSLTDGRVLGILEGMLCCVVLL